MMDYYQHEQEVANGWDETPTGSNDLIYGIGISMGYYPEVFDLMSGTMSKDDYSNRYVSADHKIKKMTERRKKSRNSYDAMRDIVLSFPNKDMFAEICRKSGIEVELFNEDARCINRLSDHEPDFIHMRGENDLVFSALSALFENRKITAGADLIFRTGGSDIADYRLAHGILHAGRAEYIAVFFKKLFSCSF